MLYNFNRECQRPGVVARDAQHSRNVRTRILEFIRAEL